MYLAAVLSAKTLLCPPPPSNWRPTSRLAVHIWNISVSADGWDYSREKQMAVYDSKYFDCEHGGKCKQKVQYSFASSVDNIF